MAKVKRENGKGRIGRLHRNMLLPVEDRLPSDNVADESDVDDADMQSVDELYTPGIEYVAVDEEPKQDEINDRQQVDRPVVNPRGEPVQDEVAVERPVPAPRRSTRERRQPAWMTSGDYVTDFQMNVPSQREKFQLVSSLLSLLQ